MTSYDPRFTYVLSKVSGPGRVVRDEASGTSLPCGVTRGLPGQSTTVRVESLRPGFVSVARTISGMSDVDDGP